MYVAVHRLQRRAGPDSREGVNAFVHEHGAIEWPQLAHDVIALKPGRLVAEEVAVRPIGGNRVVAFLDLWVPDGEGDEGFVRALLDGCREALSEEPPIVVALGDAVASFGCELGSVDRRLELFDELADTAARLTANQRPRPS